MPRRLSPARPAIAGPRRSPPLRSPRRAALTLHLAAACLAAGALPAHAQQVVSDRPAQALAPRSYDIPAGPLQAALARFSAEAGVYLAGATELVDGKHSPGLKGRFGATDGLAALLAGTGLRAVANSQGQYVLTAAPPANGVATLPAIAVSGAAVDPVPSGSIRRPRSPRKSRCRNARFRRPSASSRSSRSRNRTCNRWTRP